MFDINAILKHAKDFGDKMREVHEQLSQIKVKGTAAGGMVIVEINCVQNMVSCKIDPALFKSGDSELIEELIIAATNEAVAESRIKQNEVLQTVPDGKNDITSLSDFVEKFILK
ncbi:MAG: YbaB/EbfC family nucleoid-associated protein [Planctomycetaceae bacterium]|jgi:DNA-binding YbaB/EbfC family protein|nr:YbaB/EbfC family nucleoid-associated protein [Planctomycetaceae bacterium]